MPGSTEEAEYHIAKNRLETLVDGIFAIAMTLLVLTINISKPAAEDAPQVLPGIFMGLLPQVFTLVLAFLILAFFWHGHHRQFHFVRTVDPVLLWITIFLLITIVLVPFTTDIAGDYSGVEAAVLPFHLNILLVGLVYSLHWRYICASPQLCSPVPDERVAKVWSRETTLIPVVALIGAVLSLLTPIGSLLVYLVAPVAWYFLQRNPRPEPVPQA
jgi:uncharacterized membrane protein